MKREELEYEITKIKSVIKVLKQSESVKSIKQAKKELKQLKKQLEELPKLEVGKWYKVFRDEKETSSLVVFSGHNTPTYGFTHISRSWTESYGCHNTFRNPDYVVKPATPQEVEEALIKEAKKRGFKKGVRFNSVAQGNISGNSNVTGSNVIECTDGVNRVRCNGWTIYYKGKWATIIEQPKVTINGDFTKEDLEKIIQTEFK